MKRRRVKITGIGPVTPAGIGKEAFWRGILEPVSRVRPFKKLGEEYGAFAAAYISGFDVFKYLEDKSSLPRGTARQGLFAIACAILALRDADISFEEFRKAQSVIVTGSSLMDFGGIVSSIDAVAKKGVRGAQPRALYSTGVSSVPSAINHALRASARTMAISTQCCAGMDAIGYATELIATGQAEIAICGGAEAPLHRFPLLEFRAGDMTPATAEMFPKLARPFDQWRTTGVVSEGACMFVIEPESSPRRGYSCITGYAFANDETDGLCSGMESAARLALAAANRRPADVDVLNAWGPGHKLVDTGESRAMIQLFGERLNEMPTFSLKGAIGTPLAAAPAIQVAVAALAHRESIIPPTVNWEFPDPECPLNLSNTHRMVDNEIMLLNAHGVGGVNASLVIERC